MWLEESFLKLEVSCASLFPYQPQAVSPAKALHIIISLELGSWEPFGWHAPNVLPCNDF